MYNSQWHCYICSATFDKQYRPLHDFDEDNLAFVSTFLEEFKAGVKLLMLSDLTLQELELAPDAVREKLSEVPDKHRVPIGTTDEAIELAEAYINEGALTTKSYNDALHIALAT